MAPLEQFVTLMLVVCVTATQKTSQKCKEYSYFNKEKSACVQCSVCPTNEVIREPCSSSRDTVCGPFLEFDEFHQAPFINLLPMKNNHSQEVFVENEVSIDVGGQHPVDNVHSGAESPITLKDGRWYTLTMALLGVLSCIALVVILYIVVVCFCKKKREEKEIMYDPELCTPLPVRRSEGSNDSAGARMMVMVPNAYVPVFRHDGQVGDCEDSGQTVSSTSTNYVYFKAPHVNM